MKLKIIFQKDKYIVGITEDGKLFESYGNTYPWSSRVVYSRITSRNCKTER